ncbi:MAG: hypothetical protein PHN69_07025 [Candidatus Pacebacteria bacterium]|nr:hypothetical protein [Candidatus Paceibacterota bacterium]
MKVNLYKDYWLTSSVGDLCFTLKSIKPIQDKESKRYGEDSEVTVCYPITIENAVKTICQREMFNSKVTTLEGIIKEEKKLQAMVEELGKHVGVDSIMKNIIHLSEEFLSQGDPPKEDKPNPAKRGRKKKE